MMFSFNFTEFQNRILRVNPNRFRNRILRHSSWQASSPQAYSSKPSSLKSFPQASSLKSPSPQLYMAVSEDQARDYPPRLYDEGAYYLENKSINRNGCMRDIPQIIDAIRQDVWDKLKEFPVGVIAKLADCKVVWSDKIVHYLLCRQLRVYKKEILCLLVDQPLRFSLLKFGDIARLNTNPLPKNVLNLNLTNPLYIN